MKTAEERIRGRKGSYSLSDVEDFPSLCVKWHQSGGDEVSPPRFHSAVQHLVQINLNATLSFSHF